jgi:signal recognition particle GTPase
MAQTGKTFRVFVSSTFSDFKKEREALQKRVFPRLRDFCTENGARFQAIDLRWGVGQEAALDQQTMNICLGEIERCQEITPRPNFIMLLGDRYGWCPLPPRIYVDEFEEILSKVSSEDKEQLQWKEEQLAKKKGWYRKDDNAQTPCYCLMPRKLDLPDGTDKKERVAEMKREELEWYKIEKKMHSILLEAIKKLGWKQDDPRYLKYWASATHQEIQAGALNAPDSSKQAFCFFRTIEGLPGNSKSKDFQDLDQDMSKPDTDLQKKLEELKSQLREVLPKENIFEYDDVQLREGEITTDHIDKLCNDVYDSLKKAIGAEITMEEKDFLEKEIEEHKKFAEERSEFFTGRKEIVKNISDYIEGSEPYSFCVYGEGGSGKSALLAHCLKSIEDTSPNAKVVYRFIGVTPASSDIRSLFESLCRQIAKDYGEEKEIPLSFEDLVKDFPEFLALASKDNPLILFLDSLDQLSEAYNARNLSWFPEKLPENVRLVVSTRHGEELVILRNKLPENSFKKLEPMSLEEGKNLLEKWLKKAKRDLQQPQRKEVLSGFKTNGNPLYLKMAFEEARKWHSYTEGISIKEDIDGIINDLYDRLSDEKNHGKEFTSRAISYLTCARYGLSEDEIIDILSMDQNIMKDFKKRSPQSPDVDRIPVAVWSRFYFDLESYLSSNNHEGISLFRFFHKELGEAAKSKYLAENEIKYQEVLSDYFLSKADPETESGKKEGEETWEGPSRSLSELPYHLIKAERWDEIFKLLVDFRFLEQKSAKVGVQENIDKEGNKKTSYTGAISLLNDYNLALSDFPKE